MRRMLRHVKLILIVASTRTSWSSIAMKPAAVRVKGSAVQSAVKAVPRAPRPKVLQAFVGRMHSDTTADGCQVICGARGHLLP